MNAATRNRVRQRQARQERRAVSLDSLLIVEALHRLILGIRTARMFLAADAPQLADEALVSALEDLVSIGEQRTYSEEK